MLDIQFIRDNAEKVAKDATAKGYDVDIQKLLVLDKERREVLQQVEDLRRQRNELASKAKGQKPSEEQVKSGREHKDKSSALEQKLAEV
jgi:seryl-tRNA synthetase